MTKKDYIKFAKMFKDIKSTSDYNSFTSNIITKIENELCYIFKNDNPLFDRDRFLSACQVKES